MTRLDCVELPRRAEKAHRGHGCGFVVMLDDQEEPYCGFLPGPDEMPRDEPAAKGLIYAVKVPVETYIPEHEALVVTSRPREIYVLVLWLGRTC